MSTARRILPRSYYLMTRRTVQRQFLLRPDAVTKQIFEFCLALAAQKFGIELIAWLLMSNHYHAVIYDQKGNVPAFAQYFHRLVAACINDRFERTENVWSSDEPAYTLLAEEADVMAKVAYVLGNPVEANLVKTVAAWPGASSLDFLDGKSKWIERPGFYFSEKKSVVPTEIELAVAQPRFSRKKETFAVWATAVKDTVAKIDENAATERAANPKTEIIGVEGVLATKTTQRPKKKESRRKLRPRFACQRLKARKVVLRGYKEWQLHYRDAMKELAKAKPGDVVVFPVGTYRHRDMPNVVIGARPPCSPEQLRKHVTRIPCEPMLTDV